MGVFAPMWLMAGRATLHEGGLMHMRLLALLRLIAVTTQANRNRVRLGERWRAAGVRIVAVGAIARRARMLDFRLVNLFGLVGMAGDAYLPGARLSQNDLAVLGRQVAGAARLRLKR